MAACSSFTGIVQREQEPPKDVITSAIRVQLETEELRQTSQRAERAQDIGRKLLSLSSSENKEFVKFCEDITTLLISCFDSAKRCTLNSTKRDRLWKAYVRVCTEQIPSLWKQFGTKVNFTATEQDPLLIQSTIKYVFENMLKEYFGSTRAVPASRPADEQFTPDELNALRYACGYVPHKLLKKYEKRGDEKANQFEMCLSEMSVAGDSSDLLAYTTKWFDLVNRGGLFPLNEQSYWFFCSVERVVRQQLTELSKRQAENIKETVGKAVLEDEDVVFYWSLISQDIEEEASSVELLGEIVQLWTTIRGFSLAAHWLEIYKKASGTLTSKKTGLRKELS